MTDVGGRRELSVAVVGAVAAGALALIAGGQAWAQVVAVRPAPLPPVREHPLRWRGGSARARRGPRAARGSGRAARRPRAWPVAPSVCWSPSAGGVLVWSGLRAVIGGVDTGDLGPAEVDLSAAWPVLAVVAGVLGVVVGALAVLRGRGWPGMGRRYERPGAETPATRRSDEDRAQDAWKALDRGEDPTDTEPAPPRTRPV